MPTMPLCRFSPKQPTPLRSHPLPQAAIRCREARAPPGGCPGCRQPDASGRLTLPSKAQAATLPGLAPAGYTVTESAAPNLTNYYLTTPAADRTQSLDVTAGGTAEAHFTNTYEPYLSVTITKKVVGDMTIFTKTFLLPPRWTPPRSARVAPTLRRVTARR